MQHFTSIIDDNIRNMLISRMNLQDESVQLSDLVITKTLGSGSFGNVYQARHVEKNIQYALKAVPRHKIEKF
jgi:serine/threonine protein kinase